MSTSNNKYEKLASNTVVFAISSFSSKILSFAIRPFVTNVLNAPEVVGVTTLTTQCANLLIPIVSLGVSNAIIRFGLDKTNDKKHVFTNGLFTILLGFFVLLCLYPVVTLIPSVSDYALYLYIYVLTSCLRSLCTNFVRSRQRNKQVAIDGILCTFTTLMFYILFLVVIPLGAVGYLLAIICADFLSAVYLFTTERLWRYLDFQKINTKMWRNMLKFALPMIPAQISFWVINTSDLFFVQYLCEGLGGNTGDYWVGLLSTAYFLPTILNTLGVIFYEAWQLSAVTEEDGREAFFSKIFTSYTSVLFCCAAGIIWLCQPLMTVFNDNFFEAWRFVPLLTIAAIFTCCNQFFNSIYVVYKRSMGSFATMFTGAIANCIMNFFFIQWWGVLGAALASMCGLLIVFVLRAVHTRGLLRLQLRVPRLVVNLVLLWVEAAILIAEVPYAVVFTTLITAVVIVFNFGSLWEMGSQILVRVLGKRGEAIVRALTPVGKGQKGA